MSDERNIAHGKSVAHDTKAHGQAGVENVPTVPQPDKKPHLLDANTGPKQRGQRKVQA